MKQSVSACNMHECLLDVLWLGARPSALVLSIGALIRRKICPEKHTSELQVRLRVRRRRVGGRTRALNRAEFVARCIRAHHAMLPGGFIPSLCKHGTCDVKSLIIL